MLISRWATPRRWRPFAGADGGGPGPPGGELGSITTMLPTEDAEWVGAELTRRFRQFPKWSFAQRHRCQPVGAPGLARLVTGRPKVLAFSYGYHGTVDEDLRRA